MAAEVISSAHGLISLTLVKSKADQNAATLVTLSSGEDIIIEDTPEVAPPVTLVTRGRNRFRDFALFLLLP